MRRSSRTHRCSPTLRNGFAPPIGKFAAIQLVDVRLPTSDGRKFVLPAIDTLQRQTQPDNDQRLRRHQLRLRFPNSRPRASPPDSCLRQGTHGRHSW